MPRRPRIHLPGQPIHLVQRGHNRDACFFTDEDFLAYREWLGEALMETKGHPLWLRNASFPQPEDVLGSGTPGARRGASAQS